MLNGASRTAPPRAILADPRVDLAQNGSGMVDLVPSLLEYLDASPTPFHAVAESTRRLRAAGFTELRERDAWSLTPGGRYFSVRNGSSLIAFVCGRAAP